MEGRAIDAGEFRAAQRSSWDSAASGWEKWMPFKEAAAAPVSRRIVELAGVAPGHRVLDVACDYGEPSLTAARAAAPGGHVVATDISAEMLAAGRERAEREGVGNVEFVESAAAALDLEPQSFDAAVSRWGLIFEPDGEEVATHLRSFLKPDAHFAISSWGSPERVPWIGMPIRVATSRLGVEPPPPGRPGPLSRPTPEAIAGLLSGGGFADVEVEEIEIEFRWESPDQFTEFCHDIIAPLRALIDPHPEDVQRDAWAAVTDAARELAGGDRPLAMTNLVLLASGRA
ncbi:MAG TPA: methyltransferase domain-containing protein [Thermoleophilaceae bacterium]